MTLQLDFSSPDDFPVLHDIIEWRESLETSAKRISRAANGDASETCLRELLEKVANGHSAAFTELHQQCRPLMFSTALRVLQNRELAEEAVQEALVKIWQRASQFNVSRGNARTWICAVTRNQALDLIRQKKPCEISIDEHFAESLGTIDTSAELGDLVETQTELSRLSNLIDIMPSAMRQSVLMSCYEGYTHTEIADHMQAPVGTVKAWIRRGLQKLRVAIEAEDSLRFAKA